MSQGNSIVVNNVLWKARAQKQDFGLRWLKSERRQRQYHPLNLHTLFHSFRLLQPTSTSGAMNIPQSRAGSQKPDLLIPNWENSAPKQQDRRVLNKWFTTELYTEAPIPGECEALTWRERKSILFQITGRREPVQLYHSYFIAGCTDEMFPLSFRKAKRDLSAPAWDTSYTLT